MISHNILLTHGQGFYYYYYITDTDHYMGPYTSVTIDDVDAIVEKVLFHCHVNYTLIMLQDNT